MTKDYKILSKAVRFLAMDMVEQAQSGHPGMPMGMADVATVLFHDFLRFDPKAPDWFNRDRFVLSAGHGSALLYALLYLSGYEQADIEQLKQFRQLNARTAGHPEYGHLAGVETTTGPLGQGLANAVGMAISEQFLRARMGAGAVNHKIFCMAGDGCLMEGISHEAGALAGHLALNNLIVLWDDNYITIDGTVGLSDSTEQLMRFRTYGWQTYSVDGHDYQAIHAAIAEAMGSDKPVLIGCRTKIGRGAPTMEGSHKVHGAPLGKDEIARARALHEWDHVPFVIPSTVKEAWELAGERGRALRLEWQKNNADFDKKLASFIDFHPFKAHLKEICQKFIDKQAAMATRVSSMQVLAEILPLMPHLIGGSADLTGSNGTKPAIDDLTNFSSENYGGRYINWGVREHAMAAAMNGMVLHGGVRVYGGTFMVFADYARPSIRLAGLMGIGTIFVLTHDSIGLGEDGPTHQPVEHLASLRAIPNLLVLRPADAVETAESWAIALENQRRPSVLVLTRQNVPLLRRHADENLTQKGGYIIRGTDHSAARQITIIATGSEVSLAVSVFDKLTQDGIKSVVVSMPSMELFRAQSREYRDSVLGSAPIIAVEAAVRQGWDEFIGRDGEFIGMQGFGASGPYQMLYQHFGITEQAVIDSAKALIKK